MYEYITHPKKKTRTHLDISAFVHIAILYNIKHYIWRYVHKCMCIYKCERYACIFTRTYIIYIYVKTHFYICIQIHKSVYIHLYKVYIHIYIYLYIYICIYMNIYTHACIHVKLVPNENIRIHIDTLKCMHIPACLHMYVSKYIPASKNMYMYKYILYIYVCNGMQNRKFNHTCIWLVYTYAFTSLIQMQRFCLWDGLASQLSSSARLKEDIWALR